MDPEYWIDLLNTLEVNDDRKKSVALIQNNNSSARNKSASREEDSDSYVSLVMVTGNNNKDRTGKSFTSDVAAKIGRFVDTASSEIRLGQLRSSMTHNTVIISLHLGKYPFPLINI